MKENIFEEKQNKSVRRLEHLKEGVKPIMACVDITEDDVNSNHIVPDIVPVDLYDDAELLREDGYLTTGREEYVISPILSSNFSSHDFFDCTGVVAVGAETSSGENVSFMSHQNPDYFLEVKRQKFVDDLRQRLNELKTRCGKGTIDVVLFGGRYAKVRQLEVQDSDRDMFIQEYIDSVKLLSEQVHEVLGFYPEVIVGPKLSPAKDNAIFDTKNRRLHLMRSGSGDLIRSFNANDLGKVSKTWKPGEWGLPE